jgi:hypothetical protein
MVTGKLGRFVNECIPSVRFRLFAVSLAHAFDHAFFLSGNVSVTVYFFLAVLCFLRSFALSGWSSIKFFGSFSFDACFHVSQVLAFSLSAQICYCGGCVHGEAQNKYKTYSMCTTQIRYHVSLVSIAKKASACRFLSPEQQ